MLTRPDVLLRLEALLVLPVCLAVFQVLLHGRWSLFALLFLAPDLALVGYLAKNRPGMATALYNTVHCYALPLLLGLAAWKWSAVLYGEIAVIWIAHIAFDRLLGFGLKYIQAFKPTHVQSAAVYLSREPRLSSPSPQQARA
jgi:hypothetical protein